MAETDLNNKKIHLTKLQVQRQDASHLDLKAPLLLHLCHVFLKGLSLPSDSTLSGYKMAFRVQGISLRYDYVYRGRMVIFLFISFLQDSMGDFKKLIAFANLLNNSYNFHL
jgi:hypothetical protein